MRVYKCCVVVIVSTRDLMQALKRAIPCIGHLYIPNKHVCVMNSTSNASRAFTLHSIFCIGLHCAALLVVQ